MGSFLILQCFSKGLYVTESMLFIIYLFNFCVMKAAGDAFYNTAEQHEKSVTYSSNWTAPTHNIKMTFLQKYN